MKKRAIPHGTTGGYTNHRCRCDRCTKAIRDYQREYTHRVGLRRPMEEYLAERRANYVHGTEGGYKRGCRCEPCRKASAKARRGRRWRNIEATRAYDRDRWHGRARTAA